MLKHVTLLCRSVFGAIAEPLLAGGLLKFRNIAHVLVIAIYHTSMSDDAIFTLHVVEVAYVRSGSYIPQ